MKLDFRYVSSVLQRLPLTLNWQECNQDVLPGILFYCGGARKSGRPRDARCVYAAPWPTVRIVLRERRLRLKTKNSTPVAPYRREVVRRLRVADSDHIVGPTPLESESHFDGPLCYYECAILSKRSISCGRMATISH